VGDSRCYRVRDGKIAQLTQDHSLLNDYLRAMPDLTAEQKEELPRNVITRALGMTEAVQVDISSDEPRVGDVYVLCSDGLSGMITDDEIAEIVTANQNADEAANALIARANDHGGEDNVTAVVARVAE
jgi:protein phosphatase